MKVAILISAHQLMRTEFLVQSRAWSEQNQVLLIAKLTDQSTTFQESGKGRPPPSLLRSHRLFTCWEVETSWICFLHWCFSTLATHWNTWRALRNMMPGSHSQSRVGDLGIRIFQSSPGNSHVQPGLRTTVLHHSPGHHSIFYFTALCWEQNLWDFFSYLCTPKRL